MKKFLALMSLLVSLSAGASTMECPVALGENYFEQVTDLIQKAEGCYFSAELARVCGLGSSIDVEIAGQARAKCEMNFVDRLKKRELADYRRHLEQCFKKYSKEQGTLYLSAQAFCELLVAESFEELYTPVDQ